MAYPNWGTLPQQLETVHLQSRRAGKSSEPNVLLLTDNWALKIRKGVEIKLHSLAICVFRIMRSCMLPSLSVWEFAVSSKETSPKNGQSATDSRRWYGLQ